MSNIFELVKIRINMYMNS